MLNQIILVGKLTEDLELKEGEENQKYAILKLAIPRSFKNADGEYDKDFIAVKIFNQIAENTAEYCKKGDIVGVKGRIQCNDETEYKNEIVAERVTFLSSNQNKEEK